jgi:hypothetical protein
MSRAMRLGLLPVAIGLLASGCGGGSATSTTLATGSGSGPGSGSGSGGGSGACARSSSSTVNTPGAGNSNIYAWSPFGNYNVSYDDWQPDPGLTQWINSATCWGVTTTTSSENGSINSYSNVSRGWSNNQDLMNTRSTSGSNWTTLSGMGVQVSALTKAHMKWSMTVPSTPNTNDAVSRWDALIDIYLHTTANPAATAWPPQIDLQIMQTLMDQPVSGQAANTSGYFALVLSGSHAWQKTIGGVQYAGVIDAFNYNQPGGHTITMFPRPTMYTDSATTGLLWGPTSVVQDVGGIIAWLSQSNPTDDSGNPIKDANGNTITAPVIASSLYLTAINAGFEIDFGTAPSNNQWTTTDFWVAMQSEPDGQ